MQFKTRFQFQNAQQCEQFQMTAFGVSCATCQCSDQECPFNRRGELLASAKPPKAAATAA
jgi:hypothetical protein